MISTVGFPIAACVAMGYIYVKEIAGMRDSIINLEKSIEKLSEHIGCMGVKNED
nr:MAG TPA: YvrJ protein family protein [Caudoviricetes sp.]